MGAAQSDNKKEEVVEVCREELISSYLLVNANTCMCKVKSCK